MRCALVLLALASGASSTSASSLPADALSRTVLVGADGSTVAAARAMRREKAAARAPADALEELSNGENANEGAGALPSVAADSSDSAVRPSMLEHRGNDSLVAHGNASKDSPFKHEKWGWWFPAQGVTSGGPSWFDVCSQGHYIAQWELRTSRNGVDMVGPSRCTDGKQLEKHGGWEGHRKPAHFRKQGYTNYTILTFETVSTLCLGKDCAGSWRGVKRVYRCPEGSKIAGYRGRSANLVGQFAFFCGCVEGWKKKGDRCVDGGGGSRRRRDDARRRVFRRNCEWRKWGEWEACSVSCGGGSRKRTRTYIPAAGGGESCLGDSEEVGECNKKACPDGTRKIKKRIKK